MGTRARPNWTGFWKRLAYDALRVCVVLLLCFFYAKYIVGGGFRLPGRRSFRTVHHMSKENVKTVTLPDGTEVMVGKRIYPKKMLLSTKTLTSQMLCPYCGNMVDPVMVHPEPQWWHRHAPQRFRMTHSENMEWQRKHRAAKCLGCRAILWEVPGVGYIDRDPDFGYTYDY